MNKRIAVAGAGSLGIPVVKALVEASFPVTVLTRSNTPTRISLDPTADVSYVTVDYSSVQSLTSALRGHLGVVSTLTPTSTGSQGPLIEAAKAAGVKRFVPAEFGADMMNPNTRKLPVFQGKAITEDKLVEVAASEPSFTYTLVFNGAFLDWGIEYAFLLDAKNRSAAVFDSGDKAFSVTTLATVAKAVAAVFKNPDETKNRAIYIHDAVLSQNKLLEIAKKLDPEQKAWNVKRLNLEEVMKEATETIESSQSPEVIGAAMMQTIWASLVGDGYGGDFSGRTDKALLGLQEMSEREIEQVVARSL